MEKIKAKQRITKTKKWTKFGKSYRKKREHLKRAFACEFGNREKGARRKVILRTKNHFCQKSRGYFYH